MDGFIITSIGISDVMMRRSGEADRNRPDDSSAMASGAEYDVF